MSATLSLRRGPLPCLSESLLCPLAPATCSTLPHLNAQSPTLNAVHLGRSIRHVLYEN